MRRQAAIVFSFDVAAKLCASLATILVIRLLPTPEYAAYTVVLALVGFTTQAIAAGVNKIYILSFQQLDVGRSRGPLLGLQIITGGVASVILWSLFSSNPVLGIAMTATAAAMIATDFVKTECQRKLAFKQYSYVEVSRNFVFFIAIMALPAAGVVGWNATAVTGIQAAATLVAAIPLLYGLNLLDGIGRVRDGFTVARSLIVEEHRYLFGYFVGLAVFSQIDILMLNILANEQSLAGYGSAFRYYGLLVMVLGATHTVLFPMIATVETKREVIEIYAKHKGLVWMFTPGVLLSIVIAPWAIPFIDAGRYPEAIAVFQVLALSSIISFAFSPHINLVMRCRHYRFLFVLVSVAALGDVALNSVLIPTHGALGAAISTLLAYGTVNGAIYLRSRWLLGRVEEILPVR